MCAWEGGMLFGNAAGNVSQPESFMPPESETRTAGADVGGWQAEEKEKKKWSGRLDSTSSRSHIPVLTPLAAAAPVAAIHGRFSSCSSAAPWVRIQDIVATKEWSGRLDSNQRPSAPKYHQLTARQILRFNDYPSKARTCALSPSTPETSSVGTSPPSPKEGKDLPEGHEDQGRLAISGSRTSQPLRGVKRPETDRRVPDTTFLSAIATVST